MWNGLRTQEALEGGVFGRRKFIDVGEPGQELPYAGNKNPDPERWRGKQMGTAATKTGHLPKDYFDPQLRPLCEGDQYKQALPYRELQPDKPPKGFLTSDYSKRDEFSLAIRMEQHREQVKHEARVQKEAEQKLAAAAKKAGGSSPGGGADAGKVGAGGSLGGAKERPLLFDLVFEGEADLCIKAKRDTRNPTALSPERRPGPLKTTAALAHTPPPPGAVKPPQHPIRHCDFT